jgi:DNA-binding transcriptional LysR family regulator
MTLVQLRHILSLARTGSFTRSAEAVFLTQPAFSRSVRALEIELGQPLFDRVGKRSEPTPFGREILQRRNSAPAAARCAPPARAESALASAQAPARC